MLFQPVLFNFFIGLFSGDACEEAKAGAAAATLFTKNIVYQNALINIKTAFATDNNEHCISFGKDGTGNIISSAISGGGAISGKVPAITGGFADLHNHPNDLPPDAGDFYGLINLHKKNSGYNTRYVVTTSGTVYALLITDLAAALVFNHNYPNQPPAFEGGPPGFAVAIVDECREMKYRHHCTDEMVLAFILEKYKTGISLLKQDSNGSFKKIITSVSGNVSNLVFKAGTC